MEPKRFFVKGDGEFPFGMLRHDKAWPAKEIDATFMSIRSPSRPLTIELEAVGEAAPSKDVWLTFGWKVIEAK